MVGGVAFELRDEGWVDGEAGGGHGGADGVPAGAGVGGEALPLDEGDAGVAESAEVLDGEGGGATVIELDVGYARGLVVAGDGDGGDVEAGGEGGVDGDEAFDGAGEQELLVALDELGAMVVGDDEVEEIGFEEALLDAGEDEGGVAFGELRDHDAEGVRAAGAQGAGEGVGAVVEEFGGGEDFLLCCLRDGFGGGRAGEDAGDGGGGEAEVVGDGFKAGGLGGRRSGFRVVLSGRRGRFHSTRVSQDLGEAKQVSTGA